MYADVADYHTEHFGTSATGLIFSSGTMSQKFGTAISGSLIALLLGMAGANMITDAMGNVPSARPYQNTLEGTLRNTLAC